MKLQQKRLRETSEVIDFSHAFESKCDAVGVNLNGLELTFEVGNGEAATTATSNLGVPILCALWEGSIIFKNSFRR
jgi:hypothetical protein